MNEFTLIVADRLKKGMILNWTSIKGGDAENMLITNLETKANDYFMANFVMVEVILDSGTKTILTFDRTQLVRIINV